LSKKISIVKTIIIIIFCLSIFSNYYFYNLYKETKNEITNFENSINKLTVESDKCKRDYERVCRDNINIKSMKTKYFPRYIHGETYNEGYEDGKEEGFNEGKEEGLDEGKEEGYEDGYERGKEDVRNEIFNYDY